MDSAGRMNMGVIVLAGLRRLLEQREDPPSIDLLIEIMGEREMVPPTDRMSVDAQEICLPFVAMIDGAQQGERLEDEFSLEHPLQDILSVLNDFFGESGAKHDLAWIARQEPLSGLSEADLFFAITQGVSEGHRTEVDRRQLGQPRIFLDQLHMRPRARGLCKVKNDRQSASPLGGK